MLRNVQITLLCVGQDCEEHAIHRLSHCKVSAPWYHLRLNENRYLVGRKSWVAKAPGSYLLCSLSVLQIYPLLNIHFQVFKLGPLFLDIASLLNNVVCLLYVGILSTWQLIQPVARGIFGVGSSVSLNLIDC